MIVFLVVGLSSHLHELPHTNTAHKLVLLVLVVLVLELKVVVLLLVFSLVNQSPVTRKQNISSRFTKLSASIILQAVPS